MIRMRVPIPMYMRFFSFPFPFPFTTPPGIRQTGIGKERRRRNHPGLEGARLNRDRVG